MSHNAAVAMYFAAASSSSSSALLSEGNTLKLEAVARILGDGEARSLERAVFTELQCGTICSRTGSSSAGQVSTR